MFNYSPIIRAILLIIILVPASLVYSEVYVLDAPQFSEQNQPVTIKAQADDLPESMIIEWMSGEKQGRLEMVQDSRQSGWLATIPSEDVQGDLLSYTIIADYGQNNLITSPEYALYICPEYTYLKPQAMVLKPKLLVKKKWNSDDDSFGLLKHKEGPDVGPAAIACDNNNVYLLDSVKGRILSFDNKGRRKVPVSLPTTLASDLVIDPLDSSLIVVSQLEEKMYRVKNGVTSQTLPQGLKRKFVYPAKFSYDTSTQTLFAEDIYRRRSIGVMRRGKSVEANTPLVEKEPVVISDAVGDNIIFNLETSSKIIAVTFDKPVVCIEESLADPNGVVWILYTLEGDYRIRRLLRVDTVNEIAETAETDIWFSFKATHRMALTDNGVVFLAGDAEYGRIVKFDYKGNVR